MYIFTFCEGVECLGTTKKASYSKWPEGMPQPGSVAGITVKPWAKYLEGYYWGMYWGPTLYPDGAVENQNTLFPTGGTESVL